MFSQDAGNQQVPQPSDEGWVPWVAVRKEAFSGGKS